MKVVIKHLFLLLLGGLIYVGVETLFRGYSHYSMFILGGICFSVVGGLNEVYTWDMSLIGQMFLSSIVITLLEFITGLIVNVWLGLGVWDYSSLPYNLLGQICLLFTNIWFFLSLVAIVIDDYIRYKFFGEEKPKYKIF